ncbi:hypothetical protein B0O80DRAFT_77232 [Mortierella sp. GBAus27b]|nr:hypothetical protein BGX31_009997 [Mortierella sp. GBA43]KAI8352540.1 hypothetical protein B0O80DRAFT_77232 [Mortierella sp. GBAus27b]
MDQEYQSFRLSLDGPISRIEVFTHEETGIKIIFWEDIEFQFPGTQRVMNGDIAISPARDAKRRRIEPMCIKYHPGIVLDVFTSNGSFDSVQSHISPLPTPDSIGVHSPIEPQDALLGQSFNKLSVNTAYLPNTEGVDLLQHSPSVLVRTPSSHHPRTPSPSRVPSSPSTPSWGITGSQSPLRGAPPSPNTSHIAPRIQSTLETSASLFTHFEQSIKSGQLDQAESIKEEIRTGFTTLQVEMARNKELQLQMLDLQKTASDMQQRMIQMQQQALDRLALIQNKVQAVLTQTYELHEYPIPRLFIVLPRETRRRDQILSPFTDKFRLYFLCECGEHTRYPQQQDSHAPRTRSSSNSGGAILDVDDSGATTLIRSGSKMASHHVHLAKHEGYDLERPNEFFRKYGTHILILLQMLKYGIIAAGIVVPPLAHLRLTDELDKVKDGLEMAHNSIEPKVDYTIQYLETVAGSSVSVNDYPEATKRSMQDTAKSNNNQQNSVHDFEPLEGADLRHLSSFLKIKDESKVLGNLYRIVTNEGHVKWVCLDHYRENYRESAIKMFRETVTVNNGTFEEATGKVTVRLKSTTTAQQFYDALERAKFIQELALTLDWDTTLEDIRLLRETIRKTNVMTLKLDFCGSQGPSRDFLNKGRRYDPILQMMANSQLHALYLQRCDGFWSRLTKAVASTVTSMSSTIQLRTLSVQGSIENWKVEMSRIEDVLRNCSRLAELKLQCSDVDAAFEMVRKSTGGFQHLERLDLSMVQGNIQEQVEIVIDQPRAEISSMTITSNKRPYTQLVFSGYVRKLVLYHEFDLATERPFLDKIIRENSCLHQIGVRCPVQTFVPVFEAIRDGCIINPSLQRIEVQDSGRWNKILLSDPHDPQGTLLEIISPELAGRAEILKAFGWALRRLPRSMNYSTEFLRGLELATRTRGSALQRIHVDISTLDEERLELLVKVIQYSQPTLQILNIAVNTNEAQQRDLPATTLARYVIRLSPWITRLELHMFGLSSFLFALSSAATAAVAQSALQPPDLSRTYTLSGKGGAGAVTFPLAPMTTSSSPRSLALSMPLLQELDIQPTKDSLGKLSHCQINPPHVQWLQVPLTSPQLKTLRLGYLDILKEDWTIVLQSLRYDVLENLTLEGTNLSDGQVRDLIERLASTAHSASLHGGDESESKAVALKLLKIEGSLVTIPMAKSIEGLVHAITPQCQVKATL